MTQGVNDSLSLNITISPEPRTSAEKKKSISQDNEEARISKKVLKRKTFKDNEHSEKEPFNEKKKKQYVDGGRVSSLFGRNPEIPTVKHRKILPVKESLFSAECFSDIEEIHPHMVKNLNDSFGISQMTTVQKMAVPVLLKGKDALIRSQTGSGKTLAYAIPVLESLHRIRPKITRGDGIRALVVLPTRELALQTYEWFLKLVKSFTWIVPGMLVGGEKKKSEKARLRKGITILIGTPGRLIDHINHTKTVKFDLVQWLILDEADKLLDLGYEKDISSLVSVLRSHQESCPDSPHCQTVLLSATLTKQVEKLAGLTLQAPVRLDASDCSEEELVIPQSLNQMYVVTPAKLRLVTLAGFIVWKCQVAREGKVLIFMATQDMVDYYTELMATVLGDSTEFFKLHGNHSHEERVLIFKTFRAADSGVLFSTDVAARGLDLPSVDWIVQFNAPATPADYVHRVGRTARVGHKGSALLFLVPSELPFISQLEDKRIMLEEETMVNCLDSLQVLNFEEVVSGDYRRMGGGGGIEGAASSLQLRFETALLDQRSLHELACKAYISWVRFYATYPKDAGEAFLFKNLHLGHFAKSFALRDPPTKISGIGRPQYTKEKKRFSKDVHHKSRQLPGNAASEQHKQLKRSAISEYDSGFEPKKKKKKQK